MLALIFTSRGSGAATPAKDNRNATGVKLKNQGVTGVKHKNTGVTGRPPNQ